MNFLGLGFARDGGYIQYMMSALGNAGDLSTVFVLC